MKMFWIALAASAAGFAAAPGVAQSGGAASAVVQVRPAPSGFRSYAPGNFPVPGLPAISSGVESRVSFGRGRFFRPGRPHRPDRPNRPDRPDRPDRDHKHDRHHDYYGYGYGIGIGIGGLIDPDRGYFSSRGYPPEVVDGHVRYDYDRGYPYDHYSPPAEREVAYSRAAPRESYCEIQWARGGRKGERVPVRVCRN